MPCRFCHTSSGSLSWSNLGIVHGRCLGDAITRLRELDPCPLAWPAILAAEEAEWGPSPLTEAVAVVREYEYLEQLVLF